MLTVIIISAIALALVIGSEFSWFNVLDVARNNTVFSGRNMNYGAYALRREYHRNTMLAFLITLGLVGGGFAAAELASGESTALLTRLEENTATILSIIDLPVEKSKPKTESTPQKRLNTSASNTIVQVIKNPPPVTNPTPVANPGNGTGEPIDDGDLSFPGETPGGNGSGSGGGNEPKKEEPFVDEFPEYPGGKSAMDKFLKERISYSEWERINKVHGTIWFNFVVSETGAISEVTLERDILHGDRLAEQAMKAIKSMPKWKPGLLGGKPVSFRYHLPVKFELRNN